MWCERCGYDETNPAVCRRCGRYLHNKTWQVLALGLCAAGLAIFSHYILAGSVFRAPATRLLWVTSALTAPGSIYQWPAYMAVAGATLAALVIVPVLAGYHYGIVPGIIIGFFAGTLSGVQIASVIFPAMAALAATRNVRRVPVGAWALAAALVGGLYYLYLAWTYGPHDELYRQALYQFLLWVAIAAAVVSVADVFISRSIKHSSLHVVFAGAVLAIAPAAIFFSETGPAKIEANFVRMTYDPARALNGPLPEGYVAGLATSRKPELQPGRQLPHVFDTLKYVDTWRARALAACRAYLKSFPSSPEAPEILMLEASMHDAKVNLSLLKSAGRLETCFDRISPQGMDVFRQVTERFPKTPQGALARYYVAEGTFQSGRILEAQKLYAKARESLAAFVPPGYYPSPEVKPTTVADLYAAGDTRRRALERAVYEALLDSERKFSLIAENSDFGGQPLARFAALDPKGEDFDAAVRELIVTYNKSRLVDCLRLVLAERIHDPLDREQAVEPLVGAYPDSDVADRILLALAKAQMAANLHGDARAKASATLRRLLASFPKSSYAPEAAQLLHSFEPARPFTREALGIPRETRLWANETAHPAPAAPGS